MVGLSANDKRGWLGVSAGIELFDSGPGNTYRNRDKSATPLGLIFLGSWSNRSSFQLPRTVLAPMYFLNTLNHVIFAL